MRLWDDATNSTDIFWHFATTRSNPHQCSYAREASRHVVNRPPDKGRY